MRINSSLNLIDKVAGLLSAVFFGVIGASFLATLFMSIVSYWIGGWERVAVRFHAGQAFGLVNGEWVALIVGLAFGFGAGIFFWAFLVRRIGWFTWEEIFELLWESKQ